MRLVCSDVYSKLRAQVELLQALASLVTLLEDVDAACLQLCSQVQPRAGVTTSDVACHLE